MDVEVLLHFLNGKEPSKEVEAGKISSFSCVDLIWSEHRVWEGGERGRSAPNLTRITHPGDPSGVILLLHHCVCTDTAPVHL